MEMLETINGLARKHGVQRRMMRQALAEAAPPERKKAARQEPVLGPRKAILDGILERDRQAPRKQRHTAHRIWTRLRPGYSAHAVGEPTLPPDLSFFENARQGTLKKPRSLPAQGASGERTLSGPSNRGTVDVGL